LKVKISVLLSLLWAAAISLSALGQVTLPRILSSHMVVERDLPVHVWGTAAAGEGVEVSFRGETRGTTAGPLGRWSVYLKPGTPGGPFEMTVKGAAGPAITLTDVLVGDVWVASGQSNMEFRLGEAETAGQDLPRADNPRIRLMIVKQKAAEYPLDDVETDGWVRSTPETAKDFSAVGWYFAREIERREKVPVGVIDSTWGGTVADAWTRLAALGEDAALAPVFVQWGKMTEREEDALLADRDADRQRAGRRRQGSRSRNFPGIRSWPCGRRACCGMA